MQKNISKRFGNVIKLKPEYEERYIILHRHTFPGVLSQIKKVNIRNYSIFLFGGILFSYYEYTGTNFSEDMELIADDVTKDWWKLTDPMQEPLPHRKEGEWWTEMKIICSGESKFSNSDEPARFAFTASLAAERSHDAESAFVRFGRLLKEDSFFSDAQNINLFLDEGRVYLYFEGKEFKGGNYSVQLQRLTAMDAELRRIFGSTQNDLFWNSMKEVFHTN